MDKFPCTDHIIRACITRVEYFIKVTDIPAEVYLVHHHFTGEHININRVFAENSVGLGFLYSVCYMKPIPTHEKVFAVGKKWPKCHFSTYFFLGWVGLGLESSSVS